MLVLQFSPSISEVTLQRMLYEIERYQIDRLRKALCLVQIRHCNGRTILRAMLSRIVAGAKDNSRVPKMLEQE